MSRERVETTSPMRLTPRRVEAPARLIAGVRGRFDGASALAGIPAQWRQVAARLGRIPGQVGRVGYGLCFMRPGTGTFDYLSGVEVQHASELPEGWCSVAVPAQWYAVFEHRGHVSTIRQTIEAIGKDRPSAPRSSAARSQEVPSFFERYGEGFDRETGMGDIEIWIPVEG